MARFYDPQIAHFVQADSIIPEAGSSNGYDRYGYSNNNPVKYTDPSGHRPSDQNDFNEWKKANHGLKTIMVPPTVALTSDSLISEGEMQSTVKTLLASNSSAQSLSTKAEEGFGQGRALGAIEIYSGVPKAFSGATVISTTSGVLSDLNTNNPYYPLYLDMNWENTENGLMLQSIQATNYVPEVALTVQNVHIISGGFQADFPGPNEYASKYGVINVPVNMRLSSETDTYITVDMGDFWGFPKNRVYSIYLPKGYIPPSGCSIAPYQYGGIWQGE